MGRTRPSLYGPTNRSSKWSRLVLDLRAVLRRMRVKMHEIRGMDVVAHWS